MVSTRHCQVERLSVQSREAGRRFYLAHYLETDEAFIILSGELDIEFRNGNVHLREGELFVVPKGGEHKPFASTECAVLLIEPRGTRNTGDAAGERTAELDVCVQLK